jgi:hypothetical protein
MEAKGKERDIIVERLAEIKVDPKATSVRRREA